VIVESLILGSSLVSIVACWAHVQKHKMNVYLEMLKPTPEPVRVEPPVPPGALQLSLTSLLSRRAELEEHITELRNSFTEYNGKNKESIKQALEDARTEQQELVLEQIGLLELIQKTDCEENHDEKTRLDSAQKSL